MDSLEILNTSQSQDIFLPQTSTLFILFIIFLIIVIIIEKLFISLFLLIIPSIFILVIFLIVFHLYILRLLIFTGAFPGKNMLVQFYLRYISSRAIAKNIKAHLVQFSLLITNLVNISEKGELNRTNCEFFFEVIEPILKLIDDNCKIYDQIFYKYPNDKNEYTEKYSDNIKILNNQISSSRIPDILNMKNDHDKVVILLDSDKKYFNEIMAQINLINKLLSELLFEGKFEFSNIFTNLHIFFNNSLFRSKEYVRVKMLLDLEFDELSLLNSSNSKLDSVLIKSKRRTSLMIICGPNLTTLEHLSRSWDLDQLYVNNDIDILLWNYQGYGFSGGSANFSNVKRDIEIVYDYAKSLKIYEKIGVHGLSVRGIPACHLGKNRKIDLLIADRTFGSVNMIISSILFGKVLLYLSKILFIENVDNAQNFMEANCFKILLNDPEDSTIFDRISLKSQISRDTIKKIFFQNQDYVTNIDKQSENILRYILNIEQRKDFYFTFKYLLSFLQKVEEEGNEFELEVNDNPTNEKIENENQNNDKLVKLTSNDKVYELPMKNAINVFYYNIKKSFGQIQSCGDNLYNFVRNETKYQEHINDFFNNFFVFGTTKLNREVRLCLVTNNANVLREGIETLEMLMNNKDIKEYSNYKIYTNANKFYEYMKNIEVFFNSNLKEVDNDYINNSKGNLIPLSCGHISFYDDDEYDAFKFYLQKALGNIIHDNSDQDE